MKKIGFVVFGCLFLVFLSFCFAFKKNTVSYPEKPLVSVTIAAYNHEKYIEETLLSIINQTYKNIELIIIDDGSSDRTFEIIQNTLKKYPNRFVRTDISTQKNVGTNETSNRLNKKIKGEFSYALASDDVAYPQAIEKQLNFLLNHPDYVLVVGDNRFIDENSNPIKVDFDLNVVTNPKQLSSETFAQRLNIKDNQFNKGLYNRGLFGDYFTLLGGNHIPNGYLIRRSAANDIHFTPEAPLEDYYLMLQLSKKGKLGYIDEVLFSYRRHSKNTASKENKDKMKKIFQKTLEYENWLCIHEPFRRDYLFKVNMHKLKCKLKHLFLS